MGEGKGRPEPLYPRDPPPSPYDLARRWHELDERLKALGNLDDREEVERMSSELDYIAARLGSLPTEATMNATFRVEVRWAHGTAVNHHVRVFAEQRDFAYLGNGSCLYPNAPRGSEATVGVPRSGFYAFRVLRHHIDMALAELHTVLAPHLAAGEAEILLIPEPVRVLSATLYPPRWPWQEPPVARRRCA